MSDVTQILHAIGEGDSLAAERLLPLVYDELRRLAAQRMADERPGHTLDATALVHEAYLRLVGPTDAQEWNGRGHFFAAAAEAMRRILIENARRKQRIKHGGGLRRASIEQAASAYVQVDDVIAVNDALSRFEAEAPAAAELVKLRYFIGLTIDEAAEALGVSRSTAGRQWRYAKAWFKRELAGQNGSAAD